MTYRKKRKKTNIKSNQDRFRLSLKRSNKNVFVQLVDDSVGKTILSDSTLSFENGSNIEAAKSLGKNFAKKVLDKKIKAIIFDRGNYIFRGRVKAVAEALVENGVII